MEIKGPFSYSGNIYKLYKAHLKPIFDERTSRFLFEYYLLRVFINYIELSDEDDMIVRAVKPTNTVDDVFATEYVE